MTACTNCSSEIPATRRPQSLYCSDVCGGRARDRKHYKNRPKQFHAKRYRPDSPSVDRRIPALGYTRDNIRIISMRANLLKSDATINELEAVLAYVRSL